MLTLCQLAVTVAGNLAVLPLTGVTFPFVSFGMTSLVVNMAFLALCLNVDLPRGGPRWLTRAARRCSTSRSPRALAVVPVMLGIAAAGRGRAAGRAAGVGPAGAADRYVSVRHVAALKTFEQAIVAARAEQPSAPTAAQVLRRHPAVPARVARRLAGTAARPAAAPAPSQAERIAAQLAALDAALLRFGTRPTRASTARSGFDVGALVRRRAGRARPRRSRRRDYPGQRFELRCADLAGALSALLRADAPHARSAGLARHRGRRGAWRAGAPTSWWRSRRAR